MAIATADRQVFLYQALSDGRVGYVELDEQDIPLGFYNAKGQGACVPVHYTRGIYQGSYSRRDQAAFMRLITRSRYG